MALDIPTLLIVALFVTIVSGLLLLVTWEQNRGMPALAWWGASQLVGAVALALLRFRWGAFEVVANLFVSPLLIVGAALAWNAARMFEGRPVRRSSIFDGAIVWFAAACVVPNFAHEAGFKVVLASLIIAAYTFLTAREFWRGRGEVLLSRWSALAVLVVHGVVFSLRVPLWASLPADAISATEAGDWFAVVTLEGLLYTMGMAFLLLAMTKERSELAHKNAARTDSLTGIANRRAVLEGAERILQRQARAKRPIAVLLFDLDRFKHINDSFGHRLGDEVLKRFADVATSSLRANDLFGRLGGEEFVAILPDAPAPAAHAAAERIRAGFAESCRVVDALRVHATVSIGIAASDDAMIAFDALLDIADGALYRAKSTGRDTVMPSPSAAAGQPMAAA
jgi:diguanylate cyclase (GGDEF)-like protein